MSTGSEIVVDVDPPEDGSTVKRGTPVLAKLDGVPPVAESKGWGDMSWLRKR